MKTSKKRAIEPIAAAAWTGESILTWIIVVNVSREAGNSTIVKLPIRTPNREIAIVADSALSTNSKEHNYNK